MTGRIFPNITLILLTMLERLAQVRGFRGCGDFMWGSCEYLYLAIPWYARCCSGTGWLNGFHLDYESALPIDLVRKTTKKERLCGQADDFRPIWIDGRFIERDAPVQIGRKECWTSIVIGELIDVIGKLRKIVRESSKKYGEFRNVFFRSISAIYCVGNGDGNDFD